ncbi:heterokaryon incompatibility protein-domain-containing protein [Xylogone sp. PMI_703]|nr:heterokaryon incompatibility protein-domain-containing protein [Xylogone sp. PMI_703]
MWLLNTNTMRLEEFFGARTPPYAILSHTWDEEEVSFKEIFGGPSEQTKRKRGYEKIEKTCEIAAQNGFKYAWVDTCCIDKSSSAELSEAINSMFQWYTQSEICYAYLPDLHPEVSLKEGLSKCRWVTRGWTLQELIAPAEVVFYDSTWRALHLVSEKITGIPTEYLTHEKDIRSATVAERMSWASGRQTTRAEDMAYCLLGLFDINMPMLYGEGQMAFLRLQEEVIKKTNDLSLFAWTSPYQSAGSILPEPLCGIFAPSPSSFESCHGLLIVKTDNPHFLLYLGESDSKRPVYLVLQMIGLDQYI